MNEQDETGLSLDQSGFARVAEIAFREAGLNIPEAKQSMVQSRLARRLQATGHSSFSGYLDYVESANGGAEVSQFISALTTNVSSFFREEHHFSMLREQIIPNLVKKLQNGQRVRVWSAGCSTGQEPYSIAITLLESNSIFSSGDIRILATDIDNKVLSAAKQGSFDQRQMSDIDNRIKGKYFEGAREHESFEASQTLKDMISFRKLNLIEDWPMNGLFDVIFCRNVLIYFSEDTQCTLWPKFHRYLQEDGVLFIGHSERVTDPEKVGFQPSGITTYRRSKPNHGATT